MDLLLSIIGMVVVFIAIIAGYIFFDHLQSRSRALETSPVGYKDGMVFDIKARKLKSVRTAVHMDYKTGKRFLGKVVID